MVESIVPEFGFIQEIRDDLGEIMNPTMCNFRRALLNEHQGLSSTVMYSFNIYDKKKHLFLSSSTDCKSYGNWIVVLE